MHNRRPEAGIRRLRYEEAEGRLDKVMGFEKVRTGIRRPCVHRRMGWGLEDMGKDQQCTTR